MPFQRSNITVKASLKLVYSDVWGPAPMLSIEGHRYYIAFVDAYTRFTWIFPFKLKYDAFSVFVKFKKTIELQPDRKIKCFQADIGGEYQPFVPYLTEMGVLVEAFSTSALLINNLPTTVLQFMSPFEKLFHRKPNYNFLKVFGCSCFPYLRDYSRHKLDFHTQKCVFIGYSSCHKGYRCLNKSGKVYISRNVVFNGLEFPYKAIFSPSMSSAAPKTSSFSHTRPNNSMSSLFQLFESAHAPKPAHIPAISRLLVEPHGESSSLSRDSRHDSSSVPLIASNFDRVLQDDDISHQPSLPTKNIHPMVTRSRTGSL
ncbi:hypothetical protein EZV62_015611 [Acer yangbiense]|uniref:Integrase catalytic domain-containing protein n=1 Tax=Acer yangbiense TaxID=1000413 RepID=A0A5C7HN95_9ROSI|nr:hypothetical protein EZV62_015611 [Acer yangbiense]